MGVRRKAPRVHFTHNQHTKSEVLKWYITYLQVLVESILACIEESFLLRGLLGYDDAIHAKRDTRNLCPCGRADTGADKALMLVFVSRCQELWNEIEIGVRLSVMCKC